MAGIMLLKFGGLCTKIFHLVEMTYLTDGWHGFPQKKKVQVTCAFCLNIPLAKNQQVLCNCFYIKEERSVHIITPLKTEHIRLWAILFMFNCDPGFSLFCTWM
jgi:hypothetical protein